MNKLAAIGVLLAAGVLQVSGATFQFATSLNGLIEVPVNASPGTGTSTVTVDTTAKTMTIFATFSNLIGNTTASHIHIVAPGFVPPITERTGPVATQVPTFIGFPLGVTSGTYNRNFDLTDPGTYNASFLNNVQNGGNVDAAAATLLAALQDGRAYLNIHTDYRTGGEIRGFYSAVPEPGTWVLMSVALAGLGLRRRFGR